MAHLTVGLFENTKKAGVAVAELKENVFSRNISLIAKDKNTGKVHLHQIKETPGIEEKPAAIKGAEIGLVAGILSGLSVILDPDIATLGVLGAFAASMGVMGGVVGASVGGFFGSLNYTGIPPERAKIYKDRIKGGEVFVCVSSGLKERDSLEKILKECGASDVHTIEYND